MRVLRASSVAAVLAATVAFAPAPASAQTTTTLPPVRTIPITPAATTTTTSAPARAAAVAAPPMADTGLAADRLVPLGFLLIGLGAVLDAAARRPRRIPATLR